MSGGRIQDHHDDLVEHSAHFSTMPCRRHASRMRKSGNGSPQSELGETYAIGAHP
jgi:hypothetical protein